MRAKVLFLATIGLGAFVGGCESDLDTTRQVESSGSLGETVYREVCQRETYLGELEEQEAGSRQTVDVSGAKYKDLCINDGPAPADAPPKVPALKANRSLIVGLVDAVIPPDFSDAFQQYLESLGPLSDDGTMEHALASLGDVLGVMATDNEFTSAAERLGLRDGYRPLASQPGAMPQLVTYTGLDDFLGSTLKVIAKGGTAESDFAALMRGVSLELRSVEPISRSIRPSISTARWWVR
jgi:hypothetical protein